MIETLSIEMTTGPLGYKCILYDHYYGYEGHGYTAPEAIINAARAWAYDIAVKNESNGRV